MSTSFVKKDIKLVHVIENKKMFNHNSNITGRTEIFSFEEDAKLMVKSWEKYNEPKYKRYFLQPSSFDITEKTKNFIEKDNIFIKEVLDNPHKEKENKYTNYTVKPISMDYFQKYFKFDDCYMFFTDLDVIYFDSFIEELEEAQKIIKEDKMVVTLLPWALTSANVSGNFMFDTVFQLLKNQNIPDKYKKYFNKPILSTFVNSWFMYGHSNHFFFSEYKELAFWILEQKEAIRKQLPYDGKIYDCLEEMAEELAASIIYNMYPDKFLDINQVFKNKVSFQENNAHNVKTIYGVTKETKLYHYNSLEYFNLSVYDKFDIRNLKTTIKLIIEIFGMDMLFKVFDVKNISELTKGK